MLVGIVSFLGLFFLLLTGMPIACALGLTGIVSLAILNPVLLQGVAYAVWTNSTSFVLVAVPLFIFMGEIVQRSGLSSRFYRALSIWLRWLPGGLLHTNIVACAIFAAISGSSVGTAATMGTVAIPEMTKLKYEKKMLYGSLCAGGTLGILIPPSISMILYGALTETSIGHLFMGGVVPGLMMALLFIIYIYIHCMLDKRIAPPTRQTVTFRDLLLSMKDIIPILSILTAIICGLYLGWATPTELAGLGVLMCVIVSICYKGLTWRSLKDSAVSSVRMTSMILFVIVGAQIFSFSLFSWGATHDIAKWVLGLPFSPLGIWVLLALTYLFLGMFIDATSMLVLTIGVVYPIIVKIGLDPIWFGVTLTLLLEIGLITPPVGMNLYTIQAVAGESSLKLVVMGALPFVVLLMIGIVLLTIFPELALWLPSKTLIAH